MPESRTKKTIKNIKIALIYYIINLLVSFFSRKIFLDYLGAEVLGLNTTVANLLGFLNIAEMGIGYAVSYSLYNSLFEKNEKKISEIISVQGWLYQKIAVFVIICSIILMCFFPLIFKKANVPIWYAYATFGVLLFSALLGYFANYKQIILTADQKDYKITINIKSVTIIKSLLQIFAIKIFNNGYLVWLIFEFIATIINSILLYYLLKREYPWLKTSVKEGGILRKYYPEIIVRTKQYFTHKIGTFALQQTSPLIIYGFASLTLVAIYGNYMLIISGVTVLSNALFNSVTAGVGNLVAEGNKSKIIAFFWQLTSFRIWLASVFCFSFFILAHPFISIWIGNEYVLDKVPFLLLTIILFINLTRNCDIFLNAYGLYKDIWAPIVEAVLNIGISIILGYYFGLSGIISGVLISLILLILIWKPVFLFLNAFKISPRIYFKIYIKYLFMIVFSLGVVISIDALLFNNHMSIIVLLLKIVIYTIISMLMFFIFEKQIRKNFTYFIKIFK